MMVFRWIMLVLGGLFAAGWGLSFAVSVASDDGRWRLLCTRLRRWTFLVALTWFNTEVWGRVLLTIFS